MIKVQNLNFRYGKNIILNNISFTVPDNSCVGILGANGSGKTTLLSILSGSRKCQTGSVLYSDNTRIGYVPQENPLIPDLTVKDNLLLWYKGNIKSFKEELNNPDLKILGIDGFLTKEVRHLSGGMKKKASIAIAIINHSNLLIMDEPSAALDLPSKAEIISYLSSYKKQHGSIILATHDESELDVCDILYTIKNGEISVIDKGIRGSELISKL